jgi:hypothetical protein
MTTHVLDLLPPSFRCFQNIQRMRQKKRPGCCENGASPGALKKPFAHLIFELEDLLAKRWLGDSAFLCRSAEITGTSHGHKIT